MIHASVAARPGTASRLPVGLSQTIQHLRRLILELFIETRLCFNHQSTMSAIPPQQPQGNGLPSQPTPATGATAPAVTGAAPVAGADPATTEEEQQAAADGDATSANDKTNDDGQQANMDIPSLPEPKLPTRKDVSLKELLSKMDEYAPIVRHLSRLTFQLPNTTTTTTTTTTLPPIPTITNPSPHPTDPRRSNILLHDPRRPPPSPTDGRKTRPLAGSRHAKIHRRHRRRRLPILTHPRQQHEREQPDGIFGGRCGVPDPRTTGEPSGGSERSGKRRTPGYPAPWVWWWRSGWKSESDGFDDGGFGDGGGGVWG